jgi:hypothetical protein
MQDAGVGVVGSDEEAGGVLEGDAGSFEFGPHCGEGGERQQVECSAERGQLNVGHSVVAVSRMGGCVRWR